MNFSVIVICSYVLLVILHPSAVLATRDLSKTVSHIVTCYELKVNVCGVALGQVSMMLCHEIVKNVASTDAQDRLLWKDKTCPART